MAESQSVQVTTDETSPILRTLTIEVDAKRVRKTFDRAYRSLAKTAQVKGFRPGKVPRSVLERLYGASLSEDLERQIVSETLPEAVEQSGVQPVSEPTIDAGRLEAEAPFQYKAVLEIKPPIELPTLMGLPATRPSVAFSDEELDEELNTLRERRASLVDEPEGTEAETGATLVIDYAGRIDGDLFEGGAAEGATIELGSGRLVPGFEDQLVGATAGSEREVRITFPEDYPAEELAGKDAVFDVTVKAVQKKDLPELDDDFAKGLGQDEDLAALKERIRGDRTKAREREADREARRTLIDALIERTEFEVPAGMIDRQLQSRLQMAHQQLAQVLPHEELQQRIDEWREQWRPDAERDVRELLLLDAVAEHQEIEVSDEEVEAKIEEMAAEQGMAAPRLRQQYEEQGLISSLEAQLRQDRAFEFLLAGAKVEETTGT